ETSITPVIFNQAQKATTLEVGTRGQLEQIGWDAVLYRSQIKGEYLSLLAPNGQTTTINADKTVHQGLELGLHGTYRNG
ncbi:TonB-dependent receptor, partial [Acinetobacter baumannii]